VGHIDVVTSLISLKAKIDCSDIRSNFALMHAAMHGHSSILPMLMQARANINRVNENGETALMLACEQVRRGWGASLLGR
jgi:ankyrin repeat protein